MLREIVLEDRPYTFSDYFNLSYEIDEILAYFGYAFQIEALDLPNGDIDLAGAQTLRRRIEEGLPRISLTSETARREFLIAPVVWEVILTTKSKVRVEYPIQVNDKLNGKLDYLFDGKDNLLIIEAKHADPQRGFTQLGVELVALDQWSQSKSNILYGAVSLGDSWRFGRLDRASKKISQDLDLYAVPTHLESLLTVLVGILSE